MSDTNELLDLLAKDIESHRDDGQCCGRTGGDRYSCYINVRSADLLSIIALAKRAEEAERLVNSAESILRDVVHVSPIMNEAINRWRHEMWDFENLAALSAKEPA